MMSKSVAGKVKRVKLSPAQRRVLERLTEPEIMIIGEHWPQYYRDGIGLEGEGVKAATFRSLWSRGLLGCIGARPLPRQLPVFVITPAGRAALAEDGEA